MWDVSDMLVELKSGLSTDNTANGDLAVQETWSVVACPENWRLMFFSISTDRLGSDIILWFVDFLREEDW